MRLGAHVGSAWVTFSRRSSRRKRSCGGCRRVVASAVALSSESSSCSLIMSMCRILNTSTSSSLRRNNTQQMPDKIHESFQSLPKERSKLAQIDDNFLQSRCTLAIFSDVIVVLVFFVTQSAGVLYVPQVHDWKNSKRGILEFPPQTSPARPRLRFRLLPSSRPFSSCKIQSHNHSSNLSDLSALQSHLFFFLVVFLLRVTLLVTFVVTAPAGRTTSVTSKQAAGGSNFGQALKKQKQTIICHECKILGDLLAHLSVQFQ